jgi:glycosyltransferase involved in cell wall biosynthesis
LVGAESAWFQTEPAFGGLKKKIEMKVLHIHLFGHDGGAGGAISTRRLHSGLRKAGIDSKILCIQGTESYDVVVAKPSRAEKQLNRLTRKVTSKLGLENVLNVNARGIKRNKAYLEADIINFHRVYESFSYLAIPTLTKNKPAVFTLCDMWAITGHCYYSLDCERWKIGCGKCLYPHIYPAIQRDNTRLGWKLKNWAYSRSNLVVVAKSKWMIELVMQSMLSHFPVHHIPNGVDTKMYRPLDPEECRSSLGIHLDKKVLLFAAHQLDSFIKGGDLLLKALQSLPKSLKNETVLLLFGHKGKEISDAVDIQTVDLGFIHSDDTKAMAYSAADLFLFPTRADNFPNTIIESIACGTPVVSFRVGGVPDLIRPGITGYLAELENVNDFHRGVTQLLEDESLRNNMHEQCRVIALKEYPLELAVQRYINLYHQLLQG